MNKKFFKFLATIVAILGLPSTYGTYNQPQASSVASISSHKYVNFVGDKSGQIVSEQLADSVLTSNVRQQLGNNIVWNGHGAFIINNNQTNLNVNVNVAPYATNQVDNLGRPTVGNAFLNKTCRQYKSRNQLGQGWTPWKPQGFHQLLNLKEGYTHAYDRGHLLGYALIGGIKGFNASESNPRNIATQTAWANEADTPDATGQNYYEEIVRKAVDQGKEIRYRVTDVYDGNDLVPSGAHIEAKSTDGSVQFNVFVPNVQPNIRINYATGVAQPYYWQESSSQISTMSKSISLVKKSCASSLRTGVVNNLSTGVLQSNLISSRSGGSVIKESQNHLNIENSSNAKRSLSSSQVQMENSQRENSITKGSQSYSNIENSFSTVRNLSLNQVQLENSQTKNSLIQSDSDTQQNLISSKIIENNIQNTSVISDKSQNSIQVTSKILSNDMSGTSKSTVKNSHQNLSSCQKLSNHKNRSKMLIPQTGDEDTLSVISIGIIILSIVGILILG